jgi:hypothetical protein
MHRRKGLALLVEACHDWVMTGRRPQGPRGTLIAGDDEGSMTTREILNKDHDAVFDIEHEPFPGR